MSSQDSMPVVATKQPMDLAALVLAELCDKIDNGADLDQELVRAFDDAKLTLAAAVDRRIAFDTWIKGAIEAAREARTQWEERVQLLKAMHERFKANTLAIVQAADVPYQGSLGKIRAQRNPVGVKLTWGDKLLSPDLIDMLGIDDRFVRVKTEYSIDAAAVKAALEAGEDLPWARLDQSGFHVRFTK